MIFVLIFMAVMIVNPIGPFIPWGWNITDMLAILPLATVVVSHVLLPLALSPALLKMTF